MPPALFFPVFRMLPRKCVLPDLCMPQIYIFNALALVFVRYSPFSNWNILSRHLNICSKETLIMSPLLKKGTLHCKLCGTF